MRRAAGPVRHWRGDRTAGIVPARILHATVKPLARIVSAELAAKLDGDVRLTVDSLFAADLSGQARAFQSLVGGDMAVDKAAELAGLTEREC